MQMLVTGATGLIGSAVVEAAMADGHLVRALVRRPSHESEALALSGASICSGDIGDRASLDSALREVEVVVHCAAKVGDWGESADYARDNVHSLETMIAAAKAAPTLRVFVHISSLGVYEPRDHHGTDESVPAWTEGFDAYTRTKADAENRVVDAIKRERFPAVIIRPGFVYGARDRHVIPGLIESLKTGRFAFLGDGKKLLDNVYVKNVADAILLAVKTKAAIGEIFNVTDDPVASRLDFVSTLARHANLEVPTRHVPLWVAKPLATVMDRGARLVGRSKPPLLSMARYKFLALNLDYSIAKAKRILGYAPRYSLDEGMRESVQWFKARGII